jgi:hypothetical protein
MHKLRLTIENNHIINPKDYTGHNLIYDERLDQIEKHKRTVEQDVELNSEGQLLDAAITLAEYDAWGTTDSNDKELIISSVINHPPKNWNKEIWEHMILKPKIERLVIAGALIAAEIDRLNYINKQKQVIE